MNMKKYLIEYKYIKRSNNMQTIEKREIEAQNKEEVKEILSHEFTGPIKITEIKERG